MITDELRQIIMKILEDFTLEQNKTDKYTALEDLVELLTIEIIKNFELKKRGG